MDLHNLVLILLIFCMPLGLLCSKKEKANSKKTETNLKEVIVIGGGLAGMAAARRLQQNKNIHVKVLEAQKERYGGRIWTKRGKIKGIKGVDRELGGMLLNTKAYDGALGNLLREYELKTESVGAVQIHFPGRDGESRVFSGDEAVKLYTELFKIIVPAVREVKSSSIDRPLDVVIQEALNDYYNDGEKQFDKDLLLGLSRTLPTPLCQNFSTLLYEVENEFGWDSIAVDGMDAFIDRMVGGFGMELPVKVNLNKVVRNIKIDDNRQKVLVRTIDGKQIIADAVILAVPIGVLKSGSIIIEPKMPKDWYKAVGDIGIGYSSKVIVGFKEAFWPKDVGSFTVSSELASDGFLQMWTNSYKFSGNPYLIGNIFGEKAREWDKAPVADLKQKAKEVLGQLFGAENVASHNMTIFLHSKWSTDPFFLGSVSYAKVGNTKELWETLSKPACPYLYFAGAYTNSLGHVDSLHGAYKSGIQAADQILSNFCEMQQKSVKETPKKPKSATDEPKKKQKKDEL